MRKCLMVIICLILLCACNQKDSLSSITEKMSEATYQNQSDYVECRLYLEKLADKTIRYQVVIDSPQINLDNVKAVVVCETGVGNTVPSYGFYENDKCHLYIDKIDEENGFYKGISLLGISSQEMVICQVYVTFEVDGKIVEEYIELEENYHDAS